ncbi:hypothetical protein OXX80_000032 [Metschnikowia pulcherrima]
MLSGQGQTNVQIAVQISNSLDSLVPIGTLLYYGAPCTEYALQGISASPSWNFVDAQFLHDVYGNKLHPSLQALVFLVRHRFFSATFRVSTYFTSPQWYAKPLYLWNVRVYAVPSDINGARYMRSWRQNWSHKYSNLHSAYKKLWDVLLSYLDFSPSGWQPDVVASNSSDPAYIKMCIPFYAQPQAKKSVNGQMEKEKMHFNMQRWYSRQASNANVFSRSSLESVIKEVYGSIKTPDVSMYLDREPIRVSGIPSADELIQQLLSKKDGVLPGVTSALYPFQLRSVCKMYERDSSSAKVCVPHFVHFTSPVDSCYYYNTLDHGFYTNPEIYSAPKGGILAENMGLGKTLICLALICMTKHEVSAIPSDVLLHDMTHTNPPKKLKTLAELCSTTIAQNSLSWKYFAEHLPPPIVERLNNSPGKFFVAQQSQNHQSTRGRQSREETSTWKQLLLTSSTLVIVPENLLHQWNDEAKKHLGTGVLKRMFISERFKTSLSLEDADYISSPPDSPIALSKYDLIVVSVPVFSKVSAKPDNVFMKIHWKRLIIDEGHSMSSRSSNLSLSCRAMSAERRWVVTGTPTSGLTNLHMDEDASESVSETTKNKRRKYVVRGKFNVREDLAKLGNLVGNYFKIEPFHSQPGLWSSSIVKNLTNSNQLTAKRSLQNLLDSLMIRHSQTQVEADLVLPQLHHEAIFLEPSFHNKLAINLFTAVLAVNAVSSERVGVDYMFDSSNKSDLHRLVSNLQLSTFYWTGFKLSDVHGLAEDRKLLQKSYEAVQTALQNPRWKSATMVHEMQMYVSGLSPAYTSAFAMGSVSDTGVYGAPQLNAVQKFFYKNRFMTMTDSAALEARLENNSKSFWKDYWSRSQKQQKGKFSKGGFSSQFDSHGVKEVSFEKETKSDGYDHEDTFIKTNSGYHYEIPPNSDSTKNVCDPKQAQIMGTASAKLSYLASKLVGHQKDGVKSIVFFEYEDSAYYLTELLDILGVNYILYATFIGAERRPNNLNDFASHDSDKKGGVTLIMDLKLASHGLTVISATRVYFVNPVWSRSVEAQAIKRAHRIGQKKEVFVETLVLRGTLEEEIYKRRVVNDDSENSETEKHSGQKFSVIDDIGMQDFVLRHEFLPIDEGKETEYAGFEEWSNFQDSRHEGGGCLFGESGNSPISDTVNDMEDCEKREYLLNGSSHARMVQPKRSFNTVQDTAASDHISYPYIASEPEFSLPSHAVKRVHQKGRTKTIYTMRLFSQDNLQKLTESMQGQPGLDQLNAEFVSGKTSFSMSPKIGKSGKSVRF